MEIEALQSVGNLILRLHQFRVGTESISDILLKPDEIVKSDEKLKNASKNIDDTILYLEEVKTHFSKYLNVPSSASE